MFKSTFSTDALKKLIPKEITEKFSIKEPLSLNQHSAVFHLISNSTNEKYVIKILDKSYYDKKLYQKIFSLNNSFLLLPKQVLSDNYYYYFLYPHMTTLTDMLSTKHFTYPMLRRLINDIGEAIATLHQNNILHLDITPNNIFVNAEGDYFLGDFSSSRFSHLFPFSSSNHALRTGDTPLFAPEPEEKSPLSDFYHDCYSFCILLYMLSNDGNFPTEKRELYTTSFDALHSFLNKKIKSDSSYNSNTIKEFLSDIEHILELCDKDKDCQNYHFQISEKQKKLLLESTLNCTIKKNSHIEHFHTLLHHVPSTRHSPIPIYGLFIFCGFIFLFSLYHYLSQNNLKTKNATTIPVEYFATTKKDYAAASLKKLDLSNTNCNTSVFSKAIANNSSLQILFANQCQLTMCPDFSNLENLEELYLHNNKITSIQSLNSLSKLKVLVLSKNELTDISILAELSTLTTVDLSHNNHLQNILSLTKLKKLQYLILTNTNITKKEILILQRKLPHCTIFY